MNYTVTQNIAHYCTTSNCNTTVRMEFLAAYLAMHLSQAQRIAKSQLNFCKPPHPCVCTVVMKLPTEFPFPSLDMISAHKSSNDPLLYVVASGCSRNHLISEKYKTVQSFKLHFLQNSPLVQLNTSSSEYKEETL